MWHRVDTRALRAWRALWALACVAAVVGRPGSVRALGDDTRVALLGLALGDLSEPLPTARRRIAWEVQRRTSVEMLPAPGRVAPDSPRLFDTGLIYLAGDGPLPELDEVAAAALRRYLMLGGMLLIDDSSGGVSEAFDASVRALMAQVLPRERWVELPGDHPIYHSFYVIDRPVGRVRGPGTLEAILRAGRAMVVYSRHDLGGAWARDNLGSWLRAVEPGGDLQREQAIRLGVNLVLYALCLDYKDDQVHAPFLIRRHAPQTTP